MTTEIAVVDTASMSVELSAMSTEELRKDLATTLGMTAKVLARLAAIWAELERRGEDLSDLRGGLFLWLPMIADGRLDPEMVVRAAGQAMLLRAASTLRLADQRRILDSGVTLVQVDGDGSIKEKVLPVEKLTSLDVRRAFADGRLRTPAEQARFIAPLAQKAGGANRRGVIVKIRLTAEEYDAVRARAAETNRRVPTYIRSLILDSDND